MKGQALVILTIVFIILVSVFALSNVDQVEVNYLLWKGKSPLILVILCSVLMGGVITAAAGSVKMYHLQRTNKQLTHKIGELTTVLKKHHLLDDVKINGTDLNESQLPDKNL